MGKLKLKNCQNNNDCRIIYRERENNIVLSSGSDTLLLHTLRLPTLRHIHDFASIYLRDRSVSLEDI